jgi:hypothetical protein
MPTVVAVITTEFAMPSGLRIYCPEDFDGVVDVAIACLAHATPNVRMLSFAEIREEIHGLNNDLALVPSRKKRYFASRGQRLKIEDFEVDSIEAGRQLLQEQAGSEFQVKLCNVQIFGSRTRAEYLIRPSNR